MPIRRAIQRDGAAIRRWRWVATRLRRHRLDAAAGGLTVLVKTGAALLMKERLYVSVSIKPLDKVARVDPSPCQTGRAGYR